MINQEKVSQAVIYLMADLIKEAATVSPLSRHQIMDAFNGTASRQSVSLAIHQALFTGLYEIRKLDPITGKKVMYLKADKAEELQINEAVENN